MALYRLEPALKSAIWGGRKLIDDFGKSYDGDKLAESWELSAHPDGPCVIASGRDRGLTLPEFIDKYGRSILGHNCERFDDFPILIKLIDANADLSVQVHPNDDYAKVNENQYGKTEMWYVIDAEPGATLCYGCKTSITKDEFRQALENSILDDILNFVPVKKGDVFFIESGTIHAIGAGIVVAEIQQSSNVTYRVYDYDRVGVDGNPRELHIEKALDVANLNPPKMDYDFGFHIGKCDCFVTDLITVTEGVPFTGFVDDDSFVTLLVVDGSGFVWDGPETFTADKGQCFFLTAGSGEYTLSGNMTVIVVSVPDED